MFKCFGLAEDELILQIWGPGRGRPGHTANTLRLGNWEAVTALMYVCGPAFILEETHHRRTVHFLQKLSIGESCQHVYWIKKVQVNSQQAGFTVRGGAAPAPLPLLQLLFANVVKYADYAGSSKLCLRLWPWNLEWICRGWMLMTLTTFHLVPSIHYLSRFVP